ncbi:hypothetical protein SCHAM137S_02217 [Streptomyces chartreusis]
MRELVKTRAEGEEVAVAEEAPRAPKVLDLKSVLESSREQADSTGGTKRKARQSNCARATPTAERSVCGAVLPIP